MRSCRFTGVIGPLKAVQKKGPVGGAHRQLSRKESKSAGTPGRPLAFRMTPGNASGHDPAITGN